MALKVLIICFLISLIGLNLKKEKLGAIVVSNKEKNDHHDDAVIIEIDKIERAFWDAEGGAFRVMSLMMENSLRQIIADDNFINEKKVILHNETAITMFIPNDDKINFLWKSSRVYFGGLIMASKVDKNTFDSGLLSKGSKLNTKFGHQTRTVTGPAEIGCAKITHWGIYHDGKVIVHGVVSFFHAFGYEDCIQ